MRLRAPAVAVVVAVLASLAACGSGGTATSGSAGGDVVLVTHDSFALPKRLINAFDAQSGYHLVVRSSGDAGALTNRLVLTAGDPDGDVSFGVDNTFASRALSNDVFAPYTPAHLPAGVASYDLPGDNGKYLTPVDNGSVCVDIDKTWFASHHVPAPTSLDDLTQPAYKNLFTIPAASTSSPGMAFLLATIGKYGAGWQDYWTKLMANGARITDGWEQSWNVDFTQGGGHGDRPIVVSYDSSPPDTVVDGKPTVKALLNTCFRQVEYVGVLAGAQNTAGAQAFVDFMLSPAVQQALPTSMWVFPVVSGTRLPIDWAQYAVRPKDPIQVDPSQIDANREQWLQQWTNIVSR